ncbi:MAG: DedA family protein [Bacteroidales bacterium]|jgi:membrane protein DedA with SNARE-associated domain|nr:DedA family protein [Bacteroidales bacterium]MBR5210243.1 DedA family protein [Paludibacteraceae bacterium]MBR6596966.1 DedA family protein [Paludibacteraceae bacterium]
MIAELFQGALENLNYFWVTFFMMIESSFIPFPSEVVVIPAAFMAAEGTMSLPLVILFATIGGLLGATINYVLSYTLGRKIIYAFADSKLGHLCLLDSEKVAYAEEYFRKRGVLATLIGRLIPAVRQLISIPAGLSKMNFGKFAFFTFLGAGAWNIILACIGYAFHGVMNKDELIEKVQHYSHEFLLVLIIIFVGFVVYMIYKNKKKGASKQ